MKHLLSMVENWNEYPSESILKIGWNGKSMMLFCFTHNLHVSQITSLKIFKVQIAVWLHRNSSVGGLIRSLLMPLALELHMYAISTNMWNVNQYCSFDICTSIVILIIVLMWCFFSIAEFPKSPPKWHSRKSSSSCIDCLATGHSNDNHEMAYHSYVAFKLTINHNATKIRYKKVPGPPVFVFHAFLFALTFY